MKSRLKDEVNQVVSFTRTVNGAGMFEALDSMMREARSTLTADEWRRVTLLDTRSVPFVDYDTKKLIENTWLVWITFEIKPKT